MEIEYPVLKIIHELESNNLLPAILFRSARKQCDADIMKLSQGDKFKLTQDQQDVIKAEIDKVIEKYQFQPEVITGSAQYQHAIEYGVGAHHAGQLLAWRLMLEELMSRGLLRLLIATGTVAAGVDFPARSVVVTAHSRRGNEGFRTFSPSEFQQMSGRAGRRGKDHVGFCFVAPGKFSDARVIYELSKRPPEPLRSSYFASPSTVLNLLKYRTTEELEFTVNKSLASFVDRRDSLKIVSESKRVEEMAKEITNSDQRKKAEKRSRRILREAEDLANRQNNQLKLTLKALEELEFIERGALTDKGLWAAELCTSFVLELAELIQAGIFEDTALHRVVGLVASISGDSHRKYFNLKKSSIENSDFKAVSKIVEKVKDHYMSPSTQELAVSPDAATTVITWMETPDWEEFRGLIKLAKVAEGDVARLVTQTADNLNQISRLHKTHPDLAIVAEEARRMILRQPFSDLPVE